MPFTSPFYYCGDDVTAFQDIASHPSPTLVQERRSFAPVLLSLESWFPHVFAGKSINVTAHIVNDAEDGTATPPGTLAWKLVCGAASRVVGHSSTGGDGAAYTGETSASGSASVDSVPYYGSARIPLTIHAPATTAADAAAGAAVVLDCTIEAAFTAGARIVSTASEPLRVFPQRTTQQRVHSHNHSSSSSSSSNVPVPVFDHPSGRTIAALETLGLKVKVVTSIATLDPSDCKALVVGESSVATESVKADIEAFVNRGVRIACLLAQTANLFF